MGKKLYFIVKANKNCSKEEDKWSWENFLPSCCVFEELEEAQQHLDASFDYHHIVGEYRIIEVENPKIAYELTVEPLEE